MNYIPEIAKMLGVEIGEKFRIDFKDDTKLFMFTEDTLVEAGSGEPIYRTLADLVYGIRKIIKLPFEPKSGERYYYVYFIHNAKLEVLNSIWRCETADCQFKYCGNCFRTREEAEREKYNVYKKLTGKEWKE